MAIEISKAMAKLPAIYAEIDEARRGRGLANLNTTLKSRVERDIAGTLDYFAKREVEDSRTKAAKYEGLTDAQHVENMKQYVLEIAAFQDATGRVNKYPDKDPHLGEILTEASTPSASVPPASAPIDLPPPEDDFAPSKLPGSNRPTRQQVYTAIDKARRSGNADQLAAVQFIDSFWMESNRSAFLGSLRKEVGNAIDSNDGTVRLAMTTGETHKMTRRDWLKGTGWALVGIAVGVPVTSAIVEHRYARSANRLEQEGSGGNADLPVVPRTQTPPPATAQKDDEKKKQATPPRPVEGQPLVEEFPQIPVQRVPDPAAPTGPLQPVPQQVLVPVKDEDKKKLEQAASDRDVANISGAVRNNGWAQAALGTVAAVGVGRVIWAKVRGPLIDQEQALKVTKGLESIMRDAYIQANPREGRAWQEALPAVVLDHDRKLTPDRGTQLT